MSNKHKMNGGRFLFGLIILLIGLVMILRHAGVIDYDLYDFLISFKMLLVVLGVFIFFTGNKGVGIVLLSIGGLLIFPDVFENYKQYFWPGILVVLGSSFILGSRFNPKKHGFGGNSDTVTDNDFFDEFVIFGGREVSINSSDLKGGKSTVIFGGAEIDLRQSQLSASGVKIEVSTIFGGNTIKVPNDWTIINKVTTIFGGYSDTRLKDPTYAPNPNKTIVITGACIFGGTEIRNYDKIH